MIAAAYANSPAGTLTTNLFDIDDATAALYLQLPPNAGTLNPIGPLGIDPPAADLGFDVYLDSRGRNRSVLVSNRRLHQIDLAGGVITTVGTIRGPTEAVRDVAVLRGN